MMSQDDPISETNGNPPPVDPELLSAFYDGETSAAERASIEQWMDVSPDTLQTLDDYDQLSQDLRQLHQSTPSPALRDRVLARIGSAPLPSQPATVPARMGRGRLYSIAAGLSGLAAAALLLMTVWPPGEAPPVGDAGDAIAMNEAPVTAESFEESAVTEADSLRMITPEGVDEGVSRPIAELTMAADTVAEAPASPAEMERRIDSTLSLHSLLRKQALPEPGDVVKYLDGNANDITWVAVMVVDVQSAGDQVQLLLSRHGVTSPVDSEVLKQDRQQPGEQFLILVEADWDQLEAVIVDLNDEQFVNQLAVDAPADESVPDVLQGLQMARNAESGQIESNKDVQMFRQWIQSRSTPDAARSAAGEAAGIGQSKSQGLAGALQLPATVPDKDWQRLAAQRGERTDVLPNRDSASGVPSAAPPLPAEEADRPTGLTTGAALARPRAKTVFVIQESVP